MRILFCNVGWMERYKGLRSGDQISGGGSYVEIENRGHEVCNFSPYKKILYGYVQPRAEQIKIERLGANSEGGGTVIVGWYKDATVFRNYQKFKKVPHQHAQNGIDGYRIIAPFSNANLLSVDARVFEVPRRVKGGMGQSNIWYADSPENVLLVENVLAIVNSGSVRGGGQKRGNNQDQEKKSRVEKAAINACCTYYEGIGYEVESVEKDNAGWDLVARAGRFTLHIEVKGLSGVVFSIELTPNEYKAFRQKASNYRLVVVNNALVRPSLSICRYSPEQKSWIIEGREDRSIEIIIKESASITSG